MKYIILSLVSLLSVTACVTAQEDYYAPFRTPSMRAEVYPHAHSPYVYANGQGPIHANAHYARRSALGSAVVVSPRLNKAGAPAATTHSHGQARGIVPSNVHGHNQAARVRQNAHAHESIGAPKVARHPSKELEQRNTHRHY